MMSEVIFDADGHATNAGYIRVYHFAGNGECLGWSDEYINIGVGLPGSSTMIPPGEPVTGMVSVFNGTTWDKQEDHRGQTVYSIADRHAVLVDYIGAIKDGFVDAAPATQFDKWDGTAWVEDVGAKRAADIDVAARNKSVLRVVADNEIEWLQDAVDAVIATAEETALLAAWKTYRVRLMRIDTSNAPDIVWPETPSS
ncbi:TPA: tail fiber assembly protein [Escherichia coli]|uniref:tail fiber assembly protein n=2 Tax=Escherichia coli TaxID=562 RepID=UPI002E1884E3|nr:tail fiber assembly protein [Shigella dysenteriae]EKK2761113.1 tail fiber assembly protein [Escherichia coli]MEC6575070.1 tail fiber assembly protein [Escherichia coli]